MPLSEHEQKMLDEMERQLFADDPRLAHAFQGSDRPRRNRKRLALGLSGAVLGLILLIVAVLIPFVPLGVLGFIAMVGGIVWVILDTPERQDQQDAGGPSGGPRRRGGGPAAGPTGGSGFVQRMEDRWDRRSGGGVA